MKISSKTTIYLVNAKLYCRVVGQLCDRIGDADYFSGTVAFDHEGVACRLVASLIVYRMKVCAPDGVWHRVTDLVPVWWEFHTLRDDDPVLNDFSFAEMLTYLT